MQDYRPFTVYSPLGKRPSFFENEKEAMAFFNTTKGDVVVLNGDQEFERKADIKSISDFIEAALFWQRNISVVPDTNTIDVYTEALRILKETPKGIRLAGNTGTYKTTIMDILSLGIKKGYIVLPEGKPPHPVTNMQVIDCTDIANQYRISGLGVYDEWNLTGNYMVPITLDDLGAEGGLIKRYGDNFNLIGTLLLNRYRYWVTEGLRTHFTTNFDPDELAEIYRDPIFKIDRVGDRLQEMTITIGINGASKR